MCIGIEPCDMCLEASGQCALELAPFGPYTLEQVGEHMGLTRERVRQIEDGAILKMARYLIHWQPDMIPDCITSAQRDAVRERVESLLAKPACQRTRL